MEVGLDLSNIVLDGGPTPLPKKVAEPPNFQPMLYWGEQDGWIKMSLGMEVGLGPGDVPKGHGPQFSAHIYCGQMTGCIRIPLDMEVGLSPGDNDRWGPSSPSPKGAQPPIFGPCPLWPNSWMD